MPLAGLVKLQVEKQLGCIAPASDRGRQGPLGRLKARTTIDGRLGGEPEPEPGKLDQRMPAEWRRQTWYLLGVRSWELAPLLRALK